MNTFVKDLQHTIKKLQARIKEHNEHHLELAADRDRYQAALATLGYTADDEGNPVRSPDWDANNNGVIDNAEELENYTRSLISDDGLCRHGWPIYGIHPDGGAPCCLCFAENQGLNLTPEEAEVVKKAWGQQKMPPRMAHKECKQDYQPGSCACPDPKAKCLYKALHAKPPE